MPDERKLNNYKMNEMLKRYSKRFERGLEDITYYPRPLKTTFFSASSLDEIDPKIVRNATVIDLDGEEPINFSDLSKKDKAKTVNLLDQGFLEELKARIASGNKKVQHHFLNLDKEGKYEIPYAYALKPLINLNFDNVVK